jgi:hypothetical protein
MMGDPAVFPSAVFTIWGIGLIVTLIVFVPLAVFLLHDLWRTARNIRIYAHEALTAAAGIADHTQQIPALDATVGLAAEVLSTAETVAARLDTLATALSTRARS